MKPYLKLRTKLYELEIDQSQAADFIGVCRDTFSRKILSKIPWTSSEMYSLLELVREPEEKIGEYFPKNGGNK